MRIDNPKGNNKCLNTKAKGRNLLFPDITKIFGLDLTI
jgi:hypothetical protein